MRTRSNLSANADEIFSVLQVVARPLTAYQILHELEGTTIKAPVQVYRALSQLMTSGKVHRVESLNAFVLCDRHHATSRPGFLICKHCGTVQEFDDEAIDEISSRLAGAGFEVENLSLEVSGLCVACRSEAV
ncbi:MAG TPA: transcriptional repressor [Devosia sp.]|uniref:Fur family transcriptional regulator n=1 Tax=Devosia sp. TaxID=1871048 RepID=UPI002DDCCC1E|nr:transcriptional repressor [Devosia sp.]HEV2516106.1 transcriptional repressor [Devosia sp.]